jgi:hypothetical protein
MRRRAATTVFREAYAGPSKVLSSAELSLRPLTFTSNGAEQDARVVRGLPSLRVRVGHCLLERHQSHVARALDRRREVALV